MSFKLRKTPIQTILILSILSLAVIAQGGGYQVSWNASTGQGLPSVLGEGGEFDAVGPADGHIIVGVSAQRDPMMTVFGLVEIDVRHASFEVLIDALDPSHPYFAAGILPPSGARTFSFVPFTTLSSVGDEVHMQSLVLDPSVPGGYTLSNAIGITAAPQLPIVHLTTPRMATASTTVTVVGTNLGGVSTGGIAPTVTVAGQSTVLTSHAGDLLTIQLGPDPLSGYTEVATQGGLAVAPPDSMDAYVVVPGASGSEVTHAGTVLLQHTTIIGTIGSGPEIDTYYLHMEAGEEAFIEAFPFDNSQFQIVSFGQNTAGIACDPAIALHMPGYSTQAVAFDDNGGPEMAAAIGLGAGPRFVAPFAGDYELQIGAAYAFSTGGYLLNIRSKSPIIPPDPMLHGVSPNISGPGSTVELVASGIDLANPGSCMALFPAGAGTVSSPLMVNANGNLEVMVPAGATSGQITLVNQFGISSLPDGDDPLSNLVIPGPLAAALPSTMPQVISANSSVLGNIASAATPHQFLINLNAGDSLRVHCHPYDTVQNLVVPGIMFSSTIIDPEIIIATSTALSYFTSDAHSGAGMAASIGGLVRPPWVAPATDTYSILVRPWFFLSGGTYLLTVTVD